MERKSFRGFNEIDTIRPPQIGDITYDPFCGTTLVYVGNKGNYLTPVRKDFYDQWEVVHAFTLNDDKVTFSNINVALF